MSRPRSRIYWRARGGQQRAYADLRDYRDVGGKLEPLKAQGDAFATTDPDAAQLLLAERLKELDAARQSGGILRAPRAMALGPFAESHLCTKAATGKTTTVWLEQTEHHLTHAVAFFGAGRPLTALQPADVRRWITALRATKSRKGKKQTGATLTDGTVRHYLNSLSNLYRRAQEEQLVPPGFNPVAVLMDKPVGRRREAVFLDAPDAAYLLECARQWKPTRPDLACPFLYPLIATYLLTGGRLREVLGLEVSDVNFERKTVTFRANAFRTRLKTEGSVRVVRLWPQLAEILRDYLNARTAGEVLEGRPARALLFPGGQTDREACLATLPRKAFLALLARAGMTGQGVTPKVFRHTFTSSRLQTLDHGAPVSPFTVSRELGHGGTRLLERVYAHLGEFRCRADVLAYRVESFPQLTERLAEHGFVTTVVTTGEAG